MNSTKKMLSPEGKLFLEEEFKADNLINNIRFFILIVFAFLVYFKTDFSSGTISLPLKITALVVAIGFSYTIALFFLYKKGIYHTSIKFISTTFDITLIIISIFSFKYDTPEEYATIYFLSRFSVLYIFIILTIVRYNFWLSFYSGIVALVEYVLLVVYQNNMNGIEFSFVGKDGLTYFTEFRMSEVYLKIFYILLAGLATGLAAIYLKGIVTNSLKQETERNKLELKNKVTEVVNAENRKYLDNISNGLLLIDKDFTINNQYSKYLTDIFETDRIGGEFFINLIYPDKINQNDERKELSEFLSLLFSNTTADLSMIMEINPIVNKPIFIKHKETENTKKKMITASFHRIINNGIIENVMVIIEDVTEILNAQKQLKEEKVRHETEIEVISVILKTDRNILQDFLSESDLILENIESSIDELENEMKLNDAFRSIHSLKGTARTLGFRTISRISDTVEDHLSKIRDSKVELDYELKSKIKTLINEIFKNLHIIEDIYDRFQKFSHVDSGLSKDNLAGFIKSIKQLTADIAEELDKEIELKINKNMDYFPFFNQQIKNSIIHLIRNAADHGIEDKFERLAAGKSKIASITVTFRKAKDKYFISVQDDGKGIDFDLIKKKAIEKNIIKADEGEVTKSRLLSILFMPAFSSRDRSDGFSGRGVGLDIVKEAASKLNWKISVNTELNKGTRVTLSLPII